MKYLVLLFSVFLASVGFGQERKIDELEILYDQGHYSKVVRKSSRLLADPAYDYSGLPAYYKSLALLRMASDESWYQRHDGAIAEATELYDSFLESERVEDYIFSHYNEIARLKNYVTTLETKFRKMRLNGSADDLLAFKENQLKGIQSKADFVPVTDQTEDKIFTTQDVTESDPDEKGSKKLNFRERLVVYAKSLIGVKYKWAGNSVEGFDCSGFVGFVHKKYGIVIPRTASSQMASAEKLKLKEAQKGDLVFFGSSGRISHVGLVVTDKGNDLAMVHASTSKGVIFTDIERSDYWRSKLKAAGTFI